MSRQLLHSDILPFFSILMTMPRLKSSRMRFKDSCSSHSISFEQISTEAVFAQCLVVLWYLMVAMISSYLSGPASMLRSSSASGYSGSSSSAGLLRTSSK